MVRAPVVHFIVLAPAFNHLQVALGKVDPREVTIWAELEDAALVISRRRWQEEKRRRLP
jgi:hypothetical protein